MRSLRILVADDHEIVRRGMVALITAEPGWSVVSEVSNGRDAVESAKQLRPDVIVMDLSMPQLDGLAATRQTLRTLPHTEVVLLTMHHSEAAVREVFAAGARAYVLKSDAGSDLVAAIRAVADHRPFFSPQVADTVLSGYLQQANKNHDEPRLTERERQIVQLLAEGRSNKEVAAALSISVKTAEAHRVNINRKLGFRSVPELVRYAIRNGIVHV